MRYAERSSENRTQYTLNGSGHYTISNSTTLNVVGRHGRYAEERISPDSPTGVDRPNRFTVSEMGATASHVFNRLRVRGVLNAERRDYEDGRTPSGVTIDQDFRDHSTLTAAAIGEYAVNPSIALFLAGSVNRRDYREREGPVPARDSSGYEISAGASFELGRKMRGSFRGGYITQDYKPAQFDDVSGLLVRGELAYFLTPLVTITGTVDRAVRETGVAGATGYLVTEASLRADYELLRNLIISAGAELEKRDYANVDREDERWRYRASASYSLNRRIALRADFQRRTQDSGGTTPGRSFQENRLSVGVTLSGL